MANGETQLPTTPEAAEALVRESQPPAEPEVLGKPLEGARVAWI